MVPEPALQNLEATARLLAAVKTDFESEFEKELNRHAVPANAVEGPPFPGDDNGYGNGNGGRGRTRSAPRGR
jgi:hypothetical protein